MNGPMWGPFVSLKNRCDPFTLDSDFAIYSPKLVFSGAGMREASGTSRSECPLIPPDGNDLI